MWRAGEMWGVGLEKEGLGLGSEDFGQEEGREGGWEDARLVVVVGEGV